MDAEQKEQWVNGIIEEMYLNIGPGETIEQSGTATIEVGAHTKPPTEIIVAGSADEYRDKWLEEKLRHIEERSELVIQKYDAENKGFLKAVSDKLDATVQGISNESKARIEGVSRQIESQKNTVWAATAIVVGVMLALATLLYQFLSSSKPAIPEKITIERVVPRSESPRSER